MPTIEEEVNMKKLAMMIRGIKVAMLTTVSADGTLRSRPMATQDVEFEGTLWFFTAAGSEKMSEIRQYPQVSVSYASADDHRYVSLSGRASLIHDAGKMKELWSPVYRAWFPQGTGDPDLALLRVDIDKAEYWDTLSRSMVELL
jgi:general stress protein 26